MRLAGGVQGGGGRLRHAGCPSGSFQKGDEIRLDARRMTTVSNFKFMDHQMESFKKLILTRSKWLSYKIYHAFPYHKIYKIYLK